MPHDFLPSFGTSPSWLLLVDPEELVALTEDMVEPSEVVDEDLE